jgi:hypothetical protein
MVPYEISDGRGPKRPWPISLLCFLFTGIVFVLQAIPILGIFLMMFMAPLWSVITVNAGFIGLAAEAWTGRVSRLWMIAPLAYFGGYFVAVTLNHHAVDAAMREAAEQARAVLPFPVDRAALVIAGRDWRPLSGIRESLAGDYSIPVVYEFRGPDLGTRWPSLQGRPASHIASRLGAPETCSAIHDTPDYRPYYSESFGRPCVYSAAEDPELPQYHVTLGPARQPFGGWFAHLADPLQISDPSGRTVELLHGRVEILRWLPIPLIGCTLIDEPPEWACHAVFLSDERPLEAGRPTMAQLVARALGLHEYSAAERADAIRLRPGPDFGALSARLQAGALGSLDALLAGRASYPNVEILHARPDLLSPRADAMADELRRLLDNASRVEIYVHDDVRIVQGLIAALAWNDFARVGDKLLYAFLAVPNLSGRTVADNLAARLGDLGPDALPALRRIFTVQASDRPGGLLGLCRLGKPAAGLADRVAAIMAEKKKTVTALFANRKVNPRHQIVDEEIFYWAAYVTLIRMGREDLLEPDREVESYTRGQRMHLVILPPADATALSPDDCMVRPDSPRWPDDGSGLAQQGR